MYTLEPLTHDDSDLWEQTLVACPHSLPFHSIVWRDALTSTFKQLTPLYFFVKENDVVIGGLPAFVFQPIPGIKMLHSMPWNLFGGVQLIGEASANLDRLFEAVEAHIDPLVSEHGLCETVFTFSPGQVKMYEQKLIDSGYHKHEDLFTHLLSAGSEYDVIWQAYNKRVRGAVRKAAKTGVRVHDTMHLSDLESFYEIYLASQKRLGGTPKPYSLLKFLLKNNIAKLVVAKHAGLIIAGLLYLYFNRTVTLWVGAYVPEFQEYRANNAIFHHIIKWACESGYDWVDFGASPPDRQGLVSFKEEFGARRFDFCSYIKVHSSIKRAVWEKSEPTLRQIYTWVQQKK